MDTLLEVLDRIRNIFDFTIVRSGNNEFKLWTLIGLIALSVALYYVTGKLRDLVFTRLMARSGIEIGVRQAIANIARYALLVIGFVIIIESAGFDLTALTIAFGALGVGIGFGIQEVVNNFLCGIIILFERPIKVGDRIEVGDLAGDVVNISIRATTVMTNDRIAVIVPNSEFITSQVVNWNYDSRQVRFNIPIGVSYDEDPDNIRKLLIEVASEHAGVLEDPKPDVLFDEFADSSLNFKLRVWTREYTSRPGVLRSELNYMISRKFRAHGVEIPFPQRDLHIRTGSLN